MAPPMGQDLEGDALRLLCQHFSWTAAPCWHTTDEHKTLRKKKEDPLEANPLKNIFHEWSAHVLSWVFLPAGTNHTQADNSVSQWALSVTLWSPADRRSSWTGTHGCPELASPEEFKGEESLSASEDDQLSSVCECAVMSLTQEGLSKMSKTCKCAAVQWFLWESAAWWKEKRPAFFFYWPKMC